MSERTRDGWTWTARFPHGSKVKVKWPDGTVSEHTVVVRNSTRVVHDMGHSYEASSSVSGILVDVHGHKEWVSLNDLLVLVEKK